MKKLFIFDLDGTLLDTVKDLGKSANHILSTEGYPAHPIEKYYGFVGNGIAKLIERALPAEKATKEEVERILPKFREYYNIHKADETIPYDGIPEILERLQNRGAMIAVASNKYQLATEELINHFFPQIAFTAILGQREGIPIKPHPAIVENILNIAQCTKEDVMYIGDSVVDMTTAKNAEVESVAVSWGFCKRDKLIECTPNHIADDAMQLNDILFS